MQGLLLAFNGKTSFDDLQPCIETNPTKKYPISKKIAKYLLEHFRKKNVDQEFRER